MSSVYFYEMLTVHTLAHTDQEHLNILLSSRADTPDRTAYILGTSSESPLPSMIAEAKKLEGAGAGLLAISCNTAHCFYQGIQDSVSIPVLSIISVTAQFCRSLGIQRVGLLATEGTVASRAYFNALAELGIECITPSADEQATISKIIYEQIKRGEAPDTDAFSSVCGSLRKRGCERIILGCTELSLLKKSQNLGSEFIDSLEVLAISAIRSCRKEPTGFDAELAAFTAQN